jgi:hypothetical protein
MEKEPSKTDLPMKQVVLYTQQEAEAAVIAIKASIANTRKLVVDFYEREGWKPLGYDSFEECVNAEFKLSVSQVYRELSAGLIEKNIGVNIGDTRESHLRALGILNTDEQKERAYMLAMNIEENPTAKTFEQSAKFVWVKDNDDSKVKSNMMEGELSSIQAYDISTFLKDKPSQFTSIAERVRDPKLAMMMYRLFNEDSATWQEVAVTGHIPSVDEQIPIEDAVHGNLRAYLNIASNEHRAAAIEANRKKFDMLRECVDDIIARARLVDKYQYPQLAACIKSYDDINEM